jgi:hypothetical protein
MQMRPPGPSTRKISARARLLRADRLRTPLEMATSTDSSGSGMSSISPRRNSVQPPTPAWAAWPRARSHISSRTSSPMARPWGPTLLAARMVSMPPPEPTSRTAWPGWNRA